MRIGIVAGELSGDTLGAGLITAVHRRSADIRFEGVAGPKMIAAGCEALYHAEELAVMGILEVVRHLPRLLGIRRALVRRWRTDPPDLIIGIDAPDFNVGLESRLRAHGVATVHYVCPSIWAWRQKRVRKIRRAADRVLCLLPFEKEFLESHGVSADFVGHPLADVIPAEIDVGAAKCRLGVSGKPLVALLPGSRVGELERLAREFLKTAGWLAGRSSASLVAAMATERLAAQFRKIMIETAPDLPVKIVVDRTHDVLAAADAVLIASGTATLETALHKKPMVVAYSVSPFTYRLVKALGLMKISYFALPNLLAGRIIVPEFIQNEINPSVMGSALLDFLTNPEKRAVVTEEFAKLHRTLARNADERAADVVLSMIGSGAE